MESLRQLQQLQHQQQLEQQRQEILSLFGAFEERELQPFDAPSRGPDDLAGSDQLQVVRDPGDSQPPKPSEAAPLDGGALVDVAVRAVPELASNLPVKRKRGRPPKAQTLLIGKSIPPPPPKVDDEEDVCFICFDGGNLVLCDRKGCPKAYHPSCIKRDEEFFQSTAKWNCGWHICSACEKSAYYMCYTCTYSLCKNCTKDADYVCVRGNKGLCGTCMKTIMLIENIPHANQEMVQVDFDDKSSWEYLFKVYWVFLKQKLALTIDEVTKAKSHWEEHVLQSVQHTRGSNRDDNDPSYVSTSSSKYQPTRNTRGRKPKQQPKPLTLESPNEPKANVAEQGASSSAHPQWASKELLEFVSYMKDGDMSKLTQFDVQALLLEYIRKNNLRDPRRKCQIVCDSMLVSLFGKTALGHFEMLKLLDSHFLVKENPRLDALIREAIVDPSSNINVNSDNKLLGELDSDKKSKANVDPSSNINVNSDNKLLGGLDSDKKSKAQKLDERVLPANAEDYAAVDVHNTCLLYLRLDMMESLLDDPEKFQDKVVGSFVRVKVPAPDSMPDTFRLVQITGTNRVTEPYKIGGKMCNIKLEIVRSGKKEVISIDEISNDEFSEEECKLLRQDIKCGIIKELTVGDIHKKAFALQEVRVKHCLEAEILRLINVRDRASEKGQRKELRECVEKIQLLNSAEERQRRLLEVPEIHTDPPMDPSPRSENVSIAAIAQNKEDVKVKASNGSNRKRKMSTKTAEPNTPNTSSARPQKRQAVAKKSTDEGDSPAVQHQETVSGQNQRITRSSKKRMAQSGTTTPVICALGNPSSKPELRPTLDTAPQVSPSPLSDQPINETEENKLWHYQDPHGRVQGPFTLAQLRKWSSSGHFPRDLKIWRVEEKQEDSFLLTDALSGLFNKEAPLLPPQVARDDINLNGPSGLNEVNIAESSFSPPEEAESTSPKTSPKDETSEVQTSDPPEAAAAVVDGADSGGRQQIMTVSQVWDSLNDDSISLAQPDLVQVTVPAKADESPPRVAPNHESAQNSRKLSLFLLAEALADDGKTQEDRLDKVQEQNWKPQPRPAVTSNGWDLSSSPAPAVASLDDNKLLEIKTSNQVGEIHIPVLPSAPPPALSSVEVKDCVVSEDKHVITSSSNVSIIHSGAAASEVKAGTPASEWVGGYSSVSAKPVDPWSSILVTANQAASGAHQLIDSSASTWHANFEGSDFAALAEESVSDLLAEVEAMENGLPSPTSIMKGGQDLNESSKDDDCFSPIDGFSPAAATTVSGKNNNPFSSSSSHHLLVTSQTASVNVNPPPPFQDARRNNYQSHRPEVVIMEGLKPNIGASGSVLHRPSHSPAANWHIPVQGGLEGTSSGMEWESPRQQGGSFSRNGSFGSGSGAVFGNNQTRHSSSSGSGSRYSSPRERDRREYNGSSRSRSSSWSGRPSHSSGGGGGHRQQQQQQQTKVGHGQRVCKFYESGYCKKGASCSYLHP